MSEFIDAEKLAGVPFDEVPVEYQRKVYRVPYVQLEDSSGGNIWLTRHGWDLLDHLQPGKWFLGGRFHKSGQRLPGGSGHVYRVSTEGNAVRPIDLVVKFSRFAQDVPLQVSSEFPDDIPQNVIDNAVFNDPFQEFGLLEELRASRFGPPELRILTKRALAVYSPGESYKPSRLGRTTGRFSDYVRRLQEDQLSLGPGAPVVEIDIARQYVYLFHWVRGENAEWYYRNGLLSEKELLDLTVRVVGELSSKGFRVLDNKPRHFILRRRKDGSLLRRHGRLVYVLVDFELLQRTGDYRLWVDRQREARQTGA